MTTRVRPVSARKVRLMKLVYFICPVCQVKGVRPLAWVKKTKTLVCSRACNGQLRGKEWAKHGYKGRAAWTPEQEARFKERMRGENHPNWKGGRITMAGYPAIRMPEH